MPGWNNDPDDEIPFGGRPEPQFVEDGDYELEDEVTIEKTPDDLPVFDPNQRPTTLGEQIKGPIKLDEADAKTRASNERHIKLWVDDAIAEANKKGWADIWIHETNQRARAYVDAMKGKGRLGDEAYKELCDEIAQWYAVRLGNRAVRGGDSYE